MLGQNSYESQKKLNFSLVSDHFDVVIQNIELTWVFMFFNSKSIYPFSFLGFHIL